MDFVETFLTHARALGARDPLEGAVLGVSGGPDSMALLNLHLRAGARRIIVAHFDHHLRADSSDDAEFVAEQADRAGVAFVRGDWNSKDEARGIGVEAAAREARYRFLGQVAREHAVPVVATGHHRDDQSETVLHRILRGTGPEGLRGIHPRRCLGPDLELVRPLLRFKRSEVLAFLRAEGIPWREDPTNHDGSNLRSEIRERLLPYLSPGVPDLARRLAALATATAELNWPCPDRSNTVSPEVRTRPVLLGKFLKAVLPATAPPLDRRLVRRIRAALERGGGRVDLGRGYRMLVSGDAVRLNAPGEESARLRSAPLPCPGKVDLPDGTTIRADFTTAGEFRTGKASEVVDASALPPPYLVRGARPADRFHPLGFPAETTVGRFLAGQGVCREERAACAVVLSLDRVVWVVGHRISEQAKITPRTDRPVLLSRE